MYSPKLVFVNCSELCTLLAYSLSIAVLNELLNELLFLTTTWLEIIPNHPVTFSDHSILWDPNKIPTKSSWNTYEILENPYAIPWKIPYEIPDEIPKRHYSISVKH